MIRHQLSWLCTSLLLWASVAHAAGFEAPNPSARLKQRLETAGAGSVVEVSLKNRTKVRGRLGAVSSASFELRRFVSQKFVTETFAFDNVGSLKVKKHGVTVDESELKALSPQERLALLPRGEFVQVRLNNKQKLRGRIGELNDSGFELQPARSGAAAALVPYGELKSVERTSDRSLRAKILFVVAMVGGILMGLIAVACGTGHCTD